MGSNKTKTFHGYSRIDAELLASDAIGEPCLWGILRFRRLEVTERWKCKRGIRVAGRTAFPKRLDKLVWV
jgi:hypothetical protein